jgi:hypothetical protein
MNQEYSKLQQKRREELAAELQSASETRTAHEFESVEQMLRDDAATISVPAAVERRLSESVQQNPKPPRSWWDRWRKP